jgi:hypothetical protein
MLAGHHHDGFLEYDSDYRAGGFEPLRADRQRAQGRGGRRHGLQSSAELRARRYRSAAGRGGGEIALPISLALPASSLQCGFL